MKDVMLQGVAQAGLGGDAGTGNPRQLLRGFIGPLREEAAYCNVG
jgi:hypothetical protein